MSPPAVTAPAGTGDLTRSLTRQSLLVAAVCLFADTVAFLFSAPLSALRPADFVILIAVAAADAALALPARYSGWVALAHAVVQVLAAVLTMGPDALHQVSGAGALIAAYRAGAWLRGGPAWLALGALVLGTAIARVLGAGHSDELMIVEVVKDALLPWLVGRYTTARRGYIAELEQRAETQRREAKAGIERAVTEERSAIARDLHDVISHHVSAIGVHAGAARLRLATAADPAAVTESLAAVETSSRAAMFDLRRLLDLLHRGPSDTDRQPGIDNIDELLENARRAGLPTRFATTGIARPLPQGVEAALFRVAQEMLTNAARHGGGSAEMELRYDNSWVSLTTRNAVGQSRPAGTEELRATPRGLTGIRQRTAIFGGTAVYGSDGRHWETSVTFPVPES